MRKADGLRHVLIISSDPVGKRMSGPAIRAYETARELSRRHRVTLIAPGRGPAPKGVRMRAPKISSILDEIRRCDAVITQGVRLSATWPLFVLFPHKPAIWDLTSAVSLENLARIGSAERRAEFQHKLFLLGMERGDFFVCGGERQRDLYAGAFASMGRAGIDGLCVSAPFGIPEERPRQESRVLRGVIPGIGEDDFILLWPGGIWDWTDPLTPIRAVGRLARKRTHLVFLGKEGPAPHETGSKMARRAEELAHQLGLAGKSVHFLPGWRGYAERGRYLLEADAGVSAHPSTIEARFAYRTRLVDCLWAGLPVICSGGDEMGNWVERMGLGRSLPSEDVGAWTRAIREAARGEAWYREAPGRMAQLRPQMTWRVRLAPLMQYLESPRVTSRGWAALPRYLVRVAALVSTRALALRRHRPGDGNGWTSP
ncbi:MAG: glycosyltransferase family 4 protein [Planctomycetota bacterium]|nr:glycosyltransferase family 4 protein [Planctomycetota bacterium]